MKKQIAILLMLILLLGTLTACGEEAGTAAVESVAVICGLESGLSDRYAGMVVSGDTVDVNKDSDKKILDLNVKAGDEITEGDVLFTYDTAQMELDLQKAKLELEQLENSITSMNGQKAELEEQRSDAGESQQLGYTVQIQELENNIRETQYNAKAKEVDIQRLQDSMSITQVLAPVSGTVQSVNPDGVDSQGNTVAYIVITESGAFRVKGLINELNAGSMAEGMAVVIRSRADETVTWKGSVTKVDWEKPETSNNSSMFYAESDSMTASSRYPFYIELENSDGLLLGQHVYIEPDLGQSDTAGIRLPEYYINDIEGDAYVWAESSKGTLEKRGVTLGEYDEAMGTYLIADGISETDYLAFPDDSLTAGMTCRHAEDVILDESEIPDSAFSYVENDVQTDDGGAVTVIGGADGPETVEVAP